MSNRYATNRVRRFRPDVEYGSSDYASMTAEHALNEALDLRSRVRHLTYAVAGLGVMNLAIIGWLLYGALS